MKVLILSLSAVGLITTTSCNTMIGMGRDLQQVGRGFENKGNGRAWKGEQQQQPGAPAPVYR